MINICLRYEFMPPSFLFSMAKAFICLNGINNFSENKVSAIELLSEQVIEYIVKRSIKDCQSVVIDSLKVSPKLIQNTMKYGLVKTIVKETATNEELKSDVRRTLENLKELLQVVKDYGEAPPSKMNL